jgi:Na+-driven multidrug efflux pump
MSLGIILGPFVGQNVGANSIGRVLRSVDLSLAFNLFNGTALALVFWIFGKPILSCFHDDPEVIEHMVMIMRWLSMSWVLEGVRLLAAPVFTNLGSSVPPMVIVTIRFFVVTLPLAWYFRTAWGFDGVVFSLALGNVVAGIISYVWLKRVLPDSPGQ